MSKGLLARFTAHSQCFCPRLFANVSGARVAWICAPVPYTRTGAIHPLGICRMHKSGNRAACKVEVVGVVRSLHLEADIAGLFDEFQGSSGIYKIVLELLEESMSQSLTVFSVLAQILMLKTRLHRFALPELFHLALLALLGRALRQLVAAWLILSFTSFASTAATSI
jgi:hypothetical protein